MLKQISVAQRLILHREINLASIRRRDYKSRTIEGRGFPGGRVNVSCSREVHEQSYITRMHNAVLM